MLRRDLLKSALALLAAPFAFLGLKRASAEPLHPNETIACLMGWNPDYRFTTRAGAKYIGHLADEPLFLHRDGTLEFSSKYQRKRYCELLSYV
jgi:hypothetical protein